MIHINKDSYEINGSHLDLLKEIFEVIQAICHSQPPFKDKSESENFKRILESLESIRANFYGDDKNENNR